ncbi:capsular polysaccharide export system inner membrane protein KpsE [Litoreibacter arenae]|uniref:Capsular polysaccharide export system inner membrane protein KpsE n=1 Tax=Litoreibacter arenae DSM 19593 TaxID=1123360 RepID=S9Q742_9RHOB|nr:capsular polysaccharide export system inner membrane protein KpsE [Litoreibacter arenae]EPX77186.1 Capsular polysaccharide export system inner membrane protein KpsE [Litoreibacter arenae DSM 19593]
MTTKPKAKKYRIRRTDSIASPVSSGDAKASSTQKVDATKAAVSDVLQKKQMMFATGTDDGFGTQDFRPQDKAKEGAAKPQSPAEAIDAIRREGLTGRQLRMARRVAQKQGLAPVSDYDAVRLLREKGIDPFKRSNMLELVVPDKNKPEDDAEAKPQLPSTVTAKPSLPSTEVITEDRRATEIMAIQRDIAKRRRRRATLLAIRMMVFVLLPTFVAGYYYYVVATPMYATKSEFIIQTAEPSSAGQLGGLFSGTGLATSQDSITVQGYLQSRDAMVRLNEDEGFKTHFSQPSIDALQRIEQDSTNEAAYSLYKKHVRIGYDPAEGVIKMEVSAADPETSAAFSKKLISYAEERVDQLTSRLRGDQMQGALESRAEAEVKMREAQDRIVELQEKLGVLSPESEVQAIFGQITQLESELLTERISLQQFLANPRPNEAKVSASENKISELQKLIDEYRAQLTESNANTGSLARISGELMVAQGDLAMRQEFLAAAEGQFEAARLEANRQVRYLSVGVTPVAPDEPTYPRAFENTLLAFLIFSGIYLMVSLTASILREQV